jgi:hypothetical protein
VQLGRLARAGRFRTTPAVVDTVGSFAGLTAYGPIQHPSSTIASLSWDWASLLFVNGLTSVKFTFLSRRNALSPNNSSSSGLAIFKALKLSRTNLPKAKRKIKNIGLLATSNR